MPYFIFEIGDGRKYKLIDSFDDFRSAKAFCKQVRIDSGRDGDAGIRMASAETEKRAVALLKYPRKPASPLEEWEV